MGKGTRLPSPPAEDIRAAKPGELIHIDLWGPATVTSLGGARYFLTCYDDYSRKVHLSFLKQKSDAFSAIKSYIALVERQLGTKVKTLRSDNGGEFTSKEWDTYMRQLGIQHIRVPPDAHAQNGRVERVHLTVLNLVRTYLIDTGLPQSFWAEGASYAAYTRNRTPCGPQSAIPDDKWFGKSKRHDHLHAFGSTAYFRDHRQISKLSPRYRKGLLLGYQEGTHNYRIWDGNKVIITRDVIFPIISVDDFHNSGDDTFPARIDLSKGHKVSDHTDNVSINFQPDSIKTAARKNSGDGNF
jgi:transposase InsO family protein